MVRMPMGLRRPSPSSASSILVVSSAMSVAQARPCEVSAISISRLLAQAMRVTRPASVRRESAREKVGASRQRWRRSSLAAVRPLLPKAKSRWPWVGAQVLLTAQTAEIEGRLLAGDDEGAVPAHQIAHHPLLVEPHAGFEEKLQGLCPLVVLEGVQGAFGRGYQTLVEGREEPLAGGCYGERGVSVVIVAGSLLKGSLPHELSGAGGHRGIVEPRASRRPSPRTAGGVR